MGGSDQQGASRVGIIGTYGTENLGEETVFVSFLQWAAGNAPQIEPIALCANPGYIEKTYGVAAYPVAPRFAGAGGRAGAGERAPVQSGTERKRADSLGATRRVMGRLRRVAARLRPPVPQPLRPAWWLVKSVLVIARVLPRQMRIARSLDGAIVLGAGQIHDFWDGPFGHPIALFSWALACRMTGRPFAIVSIGAVELNHGMSRRFVRAAFKWSIYTTVRDRVSAVTVASFGVPRAYPVYPDLAWGLDLSRFIGRSKGASGQSREAPRENRSPRTVGVCPMAYRHPDLWARSEADAEGYDRYIRALADFCNRLLVQGYDVVLFPTQIRIDVTPVRDVLERISPDLVHRVRLWPVDGVPELVKCLASVDVVVASRFHGVLLSLRAGRPVLSLAYQKKCNELLEEFGEGEFGLDIHDFSAQELWERFERLRDHFGVYVDRLQAHIGENRRRLDAQYQSCFERLCRSAAG